MEPTLETINLGNDENPRIIKIVSTKERKDLQELLMEFQEVFAWSYEDMPGIDLEIAPSDWSSDVALPIYHQHTPLPHYASYHVARL